MNTQGTIAPTIHMNGTSKEALLSEYKSALKQIRSAHMKFADIEFHARDYYPQGEGVFEKARQAHVETHRKFKEIEDYLLAVLTGIVSQ